MQGGDVNIQYIDYQKQDVCTKLFKSWWFNKWNYGYYYCQCNHVPGNASMSYIQCGDAH